jgi:hypothetical protein
MISIFLVLIIGFIYLIICKITFKKLDKQLHEISEKVIHNQILLDKLQGKK